MPGHEASDDDGVEYVGTSTAESRQRDAYDQGKVIELEDSDDSDAGGADGVYEESGGGAAQASSPTGKRKASSSGASSKRARDRQQWQNADEDDDIRQRTFDVVYKWVQSLRSSQKITDAAVRSRAERVEAGLYEHLPSRKRYEEVSSTENIRAAINEVSRVLGLPA